MKKKSAAQALHEKYRRGTKQFDEERGIPPGCETKVKSQHFVQRAYLEAFCSDKPNPGRKGPVLWAHTAEKRWQASPTACATENYFYCHDPGDGSRSFLGETFLADLESASWNVIREAQMGKLPSKLKDRLTLTGYVAMALVRTPTAKALMHHAAAVVAVHSLRDFLRDSDKLAAYCEELEKETGERKTAQEVLESMSTGRVRVSATGRAWSLRMMAEQMDFFQNLFMRMNLCLLKANGDRFVTSDRPVRVADPGTAVRFKDGKITHDLTFPLSRDYCLIGTFSKAPKKLQATVGLVHFMNKLQAQDADRFVFSPFEDESFQKEIARHVRPTPDEDVLVQFDQNGQNIILDAQH